MATQTIINILIMLAGALGGWFLKVIWDAVKDLQKADTALVEKVGKVEVLVAGEYIKRDEFERTMQTLFAKLDRISDKIDGKADKH